MVQGALNALFNGVRMVIPTEMIGETVDYMEWKTGKRSEGMSFSILTFISKFTGAMSKSMGTWLLKAIGAGVKYDEVIAIGPLIMMKNVVKITKEYDIPTMVSLNPIMIDGTGMCGGCRVNIGGETKFACVDGPDFDGFKVDFDECMQRQGMFKEEEHQCRIGRGM